MSLIAQFLVGLLFGLGLLLSGMSNPAIVLNFLDLGGIPAGTWDPALAFVMIGAVAVAFAGFRLLRHRQRPLFGGSFHWPARRDLDARILVGPAIFGIGWGLAGFCPGPAFVALGYATPASAVFMAAMMAGVAAARRLADMRPGPTIGASAPSA
jgi:uncharacterized membrane protein YedE/YeeE